MAQGVLTGKYLPGVALPEGSRATSSEGGEFVKRFLTDEILSAVQNLRPIADECGLTMAQLSIAWVLQNKNVSSAIVGASRPEQVTEAAKASGFTLSADVMSAIDEALGGVIVRDSRLTASPPDRLS